MMENNYIALLTLSGLTFQYEWLRTGKHWSLALGSVALGANLLTRLTTGMDLLAVCLFLLLTAWFTNVRGVKLRSQILSYLRIALPVYGVFVLIDRAYQYARFGSVLNTYVQLFGEEWKRLDPSLPAAFPFETPFRVGFFGALFSPEKSIFLFDPLLLLAVVMATLAWKRFRPEIRAYLIAFGVLLFAYVNFYAKYTDWSGDTAWGDRYVATAAQLLALIAIPLLLRHRSQVGKAIWVAGLGIALISIAIQIASVMFWCPLERYQMETLAGPTFVVWLRFKNIVAFALGKMSAWGLTNDAMKEDPWDYMHITTLNFLPFLLKRVGKAPERVVEVLTAVWLLVLAMLIALTGFTVSLVRKNAFDSADRSSR